MPIVDRELFERHRSDFELYYSSGYIDFPEFWRSVDWSAVRLYEKFPEKVWRDGVTIGTEEDQVLVKRQLLRDEVVREIGNAALDYFEFGVRSGGSMSVLIKANRHEQSRFWGLDTFEGLPDGWVPMHGNKGIVQKAYLPGAMAVSKIPEFKDARVSLLKGVFQDTLPAVVREYQLNGASMRSRKRFINIDCDTYTGALYALCSCHPILEKGDLIYFDEFSDVLNEFMAFNDYIRSYYMKENFKLIARAYDGFLFKRV